MADPHDIAGVLKDCARIVRALLPGVTSVACHDERGEPLWLSADDLALPAIHGAAMATLLGLDNPAPVTLEAPGGHLHLLPLAGPSGQAFGVLTVVVAGTPGPEGCTSCVPRLLPVLRGLSREIALRYRLIEAHRRLSVQTAEERLLHEVEQAGHERRACETVLRRIVELCQRWMGMDSIGLVLPDQRIRIVLGDGAWSRDLGRVVASLPAALEDTGTVAGPEELRSDRPDLLCLPLLQGGRRAAGVLAMAGWSRSGFSERRRARVARYVASHIQFVLNRDYDPLTGLMAWPVFQRELEAVRSAATADFDECTLMYLDVDRLHVVNETLGREVGDEVLVRFATLARDNLAGHLVTRIASDSFAALLRGVSVDAAMARAQAICDGFRDVVFTRGDQTYRPSASIGVGPLPSAGDAAQDPLSTARAACQAAKDHGRGRAEQYATGDESIVRRVDDIHLVGLVRSAIERDRLVLVAQPIRALRPGVTTRYVEVLVRMLGASGQQLSPAEFLSTAERYQMMEELDRWVVSRSLELIAARARELTDGEHRFAINLSGQSLGSDQFLPFVSEELRRTGVPPGLICFEITESVAVTRMQQAQAFMHTLQRAGCRFSLDDFGTGLASFAYLKLFPVDSIKIDGSFIRDVVTNVVSQSMVAAISEVARVMKLETVAEFVQDEQALALLRDLGIGWAQGYLIGVPRPLEEVIEEVIGGATGVAAPAVHTARG